MWKTTRQPSVALATASASRRSPYDHLDVQTLEVGDVAARLHQRHHVGAPCRPAPGPPTTR